MKQNPYLVVLAGFAVVIFLGTVLLLLPWSVSGGGRLGFLDALFTATSATCVTGLSVIEIGERLSITGQIWVAVMIQVGGLGLMTLSTFFGLLLGISPRLRERLALREALNQVEEFSVSHLIRRIVLFTITLEVAGALLLFKGLGGEGPFTARFLSALFHSVSAFCNAGFTLYADSLTPYVSDPLVNLTVIGLVVTGGVGFWVVHDLSAHIRSRFGQGAVRALGLQSRIVLKVSALLILGGAVLFLFVEGGAGPRGTDPTGRLLAALFQSVTTRTAGFNTVDIGSLAVPTLLWMMVWMFVGASPGSTGGGIKTTTFAVMAASLRSVLTGRERTEVWRTSLPDPVVRRAYAVFFVSISWVLVASFLMTLTGTRGREVDFLRVVFETVSAFGTVGLSMGATKALSGAGKVILILTMLAGRIGPLSLILALAARPAHPDVVYPEQGIAIG